MKPSFSSLSQTYRTVFLCLSAWNTFVLLLIGYVRIVQPSVVLIKSVLVKANCFAKSLKLSDTRLHSCCSLIPCFFAVFWIFSPCSSVPYMFRRIYNESYNHWFSFKKDNEKFYLIKFKGRWAGRTIIIKIIYKDLLWIFFWNFL